MSPPISDKELKTAILFLKTLSDLPPENLAELAGLLGRLRWFLDRQGFSWSSLGMARNFLAELRRGDFPPDASDPPEDPDWSREVEEVSAAAGKVITRVLHGLLTLMLAQPATPHSHEVPLVS